MNWTSNDLPEDPNAIVVSVGSCSIESVGGVEVVKIDAACTVSRGGGGGGEGGRASLGGHEKTLRHANDRQNSG